MWLEVLEAIQSFLSSNGDSVKNNSTGHGIYSESRFFFLPASTVDIRSARCMFIFYIYLHFIETIYPKANLSSTFM